MYDFFLSDKNLTFCFIAAKIQTAAFYLDINKIILYYHLNFNSPAVGMALRGHTALKSILWETLFLDKLHDFSLLSSNSFLNSFLESKFMKKILIITKAEKVSCRITVDLSLAELGKITSRNFTGQNTNNLIA